MISGFTTVSFLTCQYLYRIQSEDGKTKLVLMEKKDVKMSQRKEHFHNKIDLDTSWKKRETPEKLNYITEERKMKNN